MKRFTASFFSNKYIPVLDPCLPFDEVYKSRSIQKRLLKRFFCLAFANYGFTISPTHITSCNEYVTQSEVNLKIFLTGNLGLNQFARCNCLPGRFNLKCISLSLTVSLGRIISKTYTSRLFDLSNRFNFR